MADNPLFPGYIPEREGGTVNPLFSGYQPGMRPANIPKGAPLPSYSYYGDQWMAQLDELSFDISGIPSWVKSRLVDDFKQNLKAAYNPETIPVDQMDDYDQDVMPGVSSVTLSLDPDDWKEPGTLLEKTAKSWIKAGTGLKFQKEGWGLQAWPIDLSDYDNNVKTTMWKVALGLQDEDTASGATASGAEQIVGATRARFGMQEEERSGRARLFNFDDAEYTVSRAPTYTVMSRFAVDTQRYMRSMKRDGKHDDFMLNMALSVGEEILGDYYAPAYKTDTEGNEVPQYVTVEENGRRRLKPKRDRYGKAEYEQTADGTLVPVYEQRKEKGNRLEIFSQVFRDNPDRKADFEAAAQIFKAKQDLAADIDLMNIFTYSPIGAVGYLNARISNHPNARTRGDIVLQPGEAASQTTPAPTPTTPAATAAAPTTPAGTKGSPAPQIQVSAVQSSLPQPTTLQPGGTPTEEITLFRDKMLKLEKDLDARLASPGLDKDGKPISNVSIDDRVTRIRNLGGDDASDALKRAREAAAQELQQFSDEYKAYLQKVRDQLHLFNEGKINERQLRNRLMNITVNGRGLVGGTTINPSIQRRLLRQINSDLTMPGRISKIDERFQLGTYLPELDEAARNGLLGEEFKKRKHTFKGFFANDARILAARLEMDRGSYAIEELFDSVTQGRFMERYLWNQVSKRLVGYTPGELVQDGLTRIGYFGLVIDDEYVSDRMRNSGLFNRLFRYKFKVSMTDEDNILGNGTDLKTIELLGSKNLKAVGTIAALLKLQEKLDDNDIFDLLTGRVRFVDAEGNINERFSARVTSWWPKDKNYARFVQEQIDDFIKWLDETKPFGIDSKTLENLYKKSPEKAKLIFNKLFNVLKRENEHYRTLKISSEYAGGLQRLGTKLAKLQDKIFNSPFFQKIFKTLLQWKNTVAEAFSKYISDILSKLLSKLLVGATGGITAIFTKLIESVLKPLIKFIVRKSLEFFQNVVGGLIRGDIGKVIMQVEKEMVRVVKFSVYIMAAPLLILAALFGSLFGTTLSSVSPVDPTKGNFGYGGALGFAGMPQYENNMVIINKSVLVNGQTNPIDPIPNSVLNNGPLTVTYTLEITAKVDIEGGALTYNDTATAIKKDTSGNLAESDILVVNETTIPEAITAGQTHTIQLTTSVATTWTDSLITNSFNVNTPETDTDPADTVTYTRSFRIGNATSIAGCFEFSPSWPDGPAKEVFETAIYNVGLRGGNYYSKLCEGDSPTITLYPATGYGTCMGGASGDSMYFEISTCTLLSNPDWVTFWFAHETVHIYQNRNSTAVAAFSNSIQGEPGMPTYPYSQVGTNCHAPGGCTPDAICPYEDMAETFGNYFYINTASRCWGDVSSTYSSDYNTFWGRYPNHLNYVLQELVL